MPSTPGSPRRCATRPERSRVGLRRLGTGLWLALVVTVTPAPTQAADPARLDVKVTGIEGAALANVRAYLAIWQQRDSDRLTAAYIKQLHRLAPAQIEAALQPFGYYRAHIDARLEGDADHWRASYAIDQGKAIRLVAVAVQLIGAGADNADLIRLTQQAGIRVGDRLNHQKYDRLKAALLGKANALGYLDADYSVRQMTIDLDRYEAKVALKLDTGALYGVGDVRFEQSGAARLDDALLRRLITFAPGDPLTSDLVLGLQTALTNSGWFKSVAVEPHKDQAQDHRAPLQVKLVTASPSKYRLGAGFGTDTGPRASVTHDRLLNARGHSLALTAQGAPKNSSAEARYAIPLRHPLDDSLVISSGVAEEDTDSRESRKIHAGVAHTQVRGGWREILGVTAEYEDYAVADIRSTSTLIYPGAAWSRTVSDHPLFPTHGWRASLNLLGSAQSLGSDVSFAQARIDAKWLTTRGHNRFIARGAVGTTITSSFTDLPPSKRFFAGGDNSVRGYDFEALGATDSDGEVIGGRHLIVGSVEYQRLLTDTWGVAVFYDAGNAFNDVNESLDQAVGVGVRWRTPIGPLRIDIARPLNDADSAYRLHLVLGPEL